MDNKDRRKVRWYVIFALITIMSLVIRILMHYRFDKSALLYVGIPCLIAIALMWIERPNSEGNWKRKFLNLALISLVIMLGSSVVLFEGFLCVLMFMPIYFGVILIVFILKYLTERYKNRKGSQLFSHVFPLLLLMSSFEGVNPDLSLQRNTQITVVKILESSISDIQDKLHEPIDLQKDRDWFLELFPMPYKVDMESMNVGDIHEVHFRYHRWFVTNTHEGSMLMEIESFNKNKIKTKFTGDTSYISHYLQLDNIEVLFKVIDETHTQVSLTISYDRLLDPAWYFDPLQQYGIKKSAEFLIDEVITPYEK